MAGKKRTNHSKSESADVQQIEADLDAIRKEKAAAAKSKNAALLAKLQEKENRLRTRLLDVKTTGFAALLSQPLPLHNESKALLEVLEERLELIEDRLSAIEDKLEKL
jgi:hypothetical protein